MVAAIVVAVLTTVVLVLVEPELSRLRRSRLAVWLAVRSSRCMRYGYNGRRRRTDEARHELESDKAADERFGAFSRASGQRGRSSAWWCASRIGMAGRLHSAL